MKMYYTAWEQRHGKIKKNLTTGLLKEEGTVLYHTEVIQLSLRLTHWFR